MRTGSAHSPDSPESGEHRPQADSTATTAHPTQLIPTQPPGRVTRKARHYVAQIVRLRDQGYTLETIQQALAAVGVQVSISTVRREALRPVPPPSWPVAEPIPSPSPARSPPPSPAPRAADVSARNASSPISSVAGTSSAKDLADAYVRSRSTNPLVRAKEHST